MDDTNNTPPMNRGRTHQTTEQASGRLPFNEATTKTGERTCTQKQTKPIWTTPIKRMVAQVHPVHNDDKHLNYGKLKRTFTTIL